MGSLAQYGLFLTKIATVAVTIAVTAVIIVSLVQRKKQCGGLWVTNLSERYKEVEESLAVTLLDGPQQKQWYKAQRRKQKQEVEAIKVRVRLDNAEPEGKPHVWVLNFRGSMDAHEVNSLREETTAVLAAAKTRDRVVIRLESPGGAIHDYGLTAPQLQRPRDKQTPLTTAVDKVATSGGCMMACVINKTVPAPLTTPGSIGAVMQISSLHRSLKSKDTDIELHTAGQYKRTFTMLGENTEEGRHKLREDLNKMHRLLRDLVRWMCPGLDIKQVATGGHWYGVQAPEKGLVDAVETNGELLLRLMESYEVIGVRYQQREEMLDRFTGNAVESVD